MDYIFPLLTIVVICFISATQSAARKYGWFAATHPWALKVAKRIQFKIEEYSRQSFYDIETYNHPMPLQCMQHIEIEWILEQSSNGKADIKMHYVAEAGTLFLMKYISKKMEPDVHYNRRYDLIYKMVINDLSKMGYTPDNEEESRI